MLSVPDETVSPAEAEGAPPLVNADRDRDASSVLMLAGSDSTKLGDGRRIGVKVERAAMA
jgi:hypothetical protein